MEILWIILVILLLLAAMVLGIAYYCFRRAFYNARKDEIRLEDHPIPVGDIYLPFKDAMVAWRNETREMPRENFEIKSFDGLTLRGEYYEYEKGAPIELMFHGYRGSAERDLCGGVQRCFALGRSVLRVDQRASGHSEGNIISFGINEHKDCLSWVDFMISHFGEDVKIIMTGISMGAATVMMAAGKPLPKNVVGVLADCGYTSPKEIILKVIGEDMGLPANLAYPFVKLGAKVFGHFDIDEFSPIEAMRKCKVPVIFIHGEADSYVPCDMSRRNYKACRAPKKLVTIPDTDHGLSYLVAPDLYLEAVSEFSRENGIPVK